MYFKLESMFRADICNELINDKFCDICKVGKPKPNYKGVYFKADKLRHAYATKKSDCAKNWPMTIGSSCSLLLHENIVSELIKKNVNGVKFHPIAGIVGGVLNRLPSAPTYYKVEPLGFVDFFPSLEKFEILSCVCEMRPRYAGDWKEPFEIKKDSSIPGDFLNLRYYSSWICVTKVVINILVENNWVDDFQIGDRALPGMRITEFGEAWYENALAQLKRSFPESALFE
jgi:hypothetical protein